MISQSPVFIFGEPTATYMAFDINEQLVHGDSVRQDLAGGRVFR